MHVALIGDSTFDNRAYTEGGPDVAAHLRRLLLPSDAVSLLAQDGAVIDDLEVQIFELDRLLRLEEDAVTHVALSVGGNDLMAISGVLEHGARSVGEGLLALREAARHFGERYRGLVDTVLDTIRRADEDRWPGGGRRPGRPLPDGRTVICTVYGGAFEDPVRAAIVETALRIFDHEMIVAGGERDLPVVDLRRVCSEPRDYWNPIEPGERGGAKIAAAVLGALRAPRYDLGGAAVTLQGTGGLVR